MLLTPIVYDGQLQRRLMPGDVLCGFEPALPATDAASGITFTANNLLSSTYVRNPAGASTDSYPSADVLISALQAGLGLAYGLPVGLSFRWRIVNLSAFLLTGQMFSNTGGTLVRGTVPASTTKDFLIQITNGTPLQTVPQLTFVNASPVISGFTAAQIALLSPGMVVTNAIANFQGQTILGVNATALTVTMSINSNTSSAGNSVTFSPTYTVTGLGA